jgi:hypothetical protein
VKTTTNFDASKFATGYFDFCDQLTYKKLGFYYSAFFKNWIGNAIEDWAEADQFVVWFEKDELLKIDVIKDRKVINTFSREDWLKPKVDLDNKSSTEENPFVKEYVANEAKFMKFIRFSSEVVLISGSSFILPITVTPNPNGQ